jgi:hypothetical protein
VYRFSRSIYRELAPRLSHLNGDCRAARRHVLEASEATMRRLAYDRQYFARPARSLFREVRNDFQLTDQLHVYRVIERYVILAIAYLERLPDDVGLDGEPRHCSASTRKGKPCQREPLPGRDYCPSHKHLEEAFEAPDEVGVAA